MSNWWEAAPLVDEPMRPMVAHTPKSGGNWWEAAPLVDEPSDVGTLDEEPRAPAIGIDPRLEPESMANEAQAAEIPGNVLGGYANYAAMATAPTAMRGVQNIASGGLLSRLRPIITGAALGAGQAALRGDDVARGAIEGAVIMAGAGGSGVARTAAKTAATEAAPDAAALLKVARSASATSAERHAARVALQKMGWVPEAAETAAPVARKIAPIPDKGNVKPATIFTKPDPVQAPRPLTEMQIVTRGRQEEAAKAAGLDLKEVFGRQTAKAAPQNKLMAFGKEVATRNPKVGEKIWVLLDDAGNPVKELTPGEAGAAARKGLKTTWVKNLWTN